MRAAVCAFACLLPATAGAVDYLELEVAGRSRSALVHPGGGDGPAPLIVVFHGLGDDAQPFATAVGFHKEWPEATVVYPRGEPRAERRGMRGWQGFPERDEHRDIAFVDALLAELRRRYPVDPERVYAAGFSNGGHLTFNLLMQRPCAFAAFAPVGAVAEYIRDATVPRPVIYLFGRGEDADLQLPWAETVVALARLNRASGERRELGDGLVELLPGEGGARLVYGAYREGHVWPSKGNAWIRGFLEQHAGRCPS